MLYVFLNPPAKGRAIAIPVDLDNQVNNLFVKSNNIVQKTAMSWRLTARNAARRDSIVTASRDYRNIIERLQVRFVWVCAALCLFIAQKPSGCCFICNIGHRVRSRRPSSSTGPGWVVRSGGCAASAWAALPWEHRLAQEVRERRIYMQVRKAAIYEIYN